MSAASSRVRRREGRDDPGGELITSVDGRPTPTLDALTSVLAELKPGKVVPVVVAKQDGTKATLHFTLGSYAGTG